MKKRIDDIEILRAFAVIFVIIEHTQQNLFAWNTPTLKAFYGYFGGWVGVDLFFVISGYVIARELVPRLQGSDSNQAFFRNTLVFWVRRFWRLLPSAWFWLCFILVASIVFRDSGIWGPVQNNLEMALSALLQVANFHVAHVFGKEFAGAAFVYWSLSMEEQFYLALPFIILLSGRRLPYVLGLIVVSQLFLERSTALLALLRTDALFLGVLIALWSHSRFFELFNPRFLRRPVVAVVVIPLLLGILACVGSDKIFVTEFRYGLVACISGLLVLAASYDEDYFARWSWLKLPLLWVGTRSYALYLIHVPSYFLTREIWLRVEPAGTRFNTDYTYYFLATAVVLLVALSELNYRLIETPLRRHGLGIARKMEDRNIKQSAELTGQHYD